ncbi:bacterial Ig-like domain-containing protein [Listeria monocytogenes]|nr:bacterial Ig-like domain-containing protein [Listeria monocytogenes]
MFFMNSKLKSINISGWDTSSITNMERAFEGLGYVETIVLGEKSVFNSTVGLPRLYGKFWKRIIPETPESVYLSSDDFMTNYDGTMPGTYILVTNKATLKVKDSTLYVGDNWTAASNFVSATDRDGNELTVADLQIEETVDTTKAGVYEITYKNGNLSETAKVTVKENKTTLKVKDSTLYVGDNWTAASNFISATGKDGNTLELDELQIEGIVNTKMAGIYEVTYKNGNLSKVAKVTVKEKTFISTSNGNQGGKQSQDKGSKNKQQSTNNSLPKAGEKSALYLSIMGILLISGLVMMYRRTKIKN